MSNNRGIVFRPFSLLYFTILFVLYLLISPFFITFFRNILVRGIGIPPETFGVVLFLSLFGSFVNIPLTTVETQAPIYTYKEIKFFRVTWRVPSMEVGISRTRVSINLGGAIVPILISTYITFWNIPKCSPNLIITYSKLLFLLIVVALTTYRNSRIIKGLGIATPMLGPPLATALTTIIIHIVNPVACPTQISYVGGTLGALVGADLMNLHKLPKLGAPMVSIGGAGTFDGIYLTGLISVLLVILLL